MLNMDAWRVVWWCNDEVHCILDNTQNAESSPLVFSKKTYQVQYTENVKTCVKNKTTSIAKCI